MREVLWDVGIDVVFQIREIDQFFYEKIEIGFPHCIGCALKVFVNWSSGDSGSLASDKGVVHRILRYGFE